MQTPIQHIILSLLLCGTLFTAACSSKEGTQNKVNKSVEKSVTDNSNKPTKVKETTKSQEAKSSQTTDTKMQTLENVQIDMTNSHNFLALNAKKDGVTTTTSGLQYRVLTKGTGPKPTTVSVVEVHYRGTFPNGEEFDSSYKRGEPASFGVTRVIKGWTEALLLMNEGSKYELVIPSELAYGARGAGNVIPPNQVLKFEVELLNANLE